MLSDSYFLFVGLSFCIFLITFFNTFLESCSVTRLNFFKLISFIFCGILISKAIFILTNNFTQMGLNGGYVFMGVLAPFVISWYYSGANERQFFNSIELALRLLMHLDGSGAILMVVVLEIYLNLILV